MKKIFAAILALNILLFSGCSAMSQFVEKFSGRNEKKAQPKLEITEIGIQKQGDKEVSILLYPEVADEPIELEEGLTFRTSIEKIDFGGEIFDSGMWFEFEDEAPRKFWMLNTVIPLDILFIDKDFKIIYIAKAQPCKKDPCGTYGPDEPIKYVLEVRGGFTKAQGVRVGDIIVPNIGMLEGPPQPPGTLKFVD